MSSVYLLTDWAIAVSELERHLEAASGNEFLVGVRSMGTDIQPVHELVARTSVGLPSTVVQVRWRGMAMEQMPAVERFFATSVLTQDPGALLWDDYNHTLHSASWPTCAGFVPVAVPPGLVRFHVDFVSERTQRRCPSAELLERLEEEFPFLLPRSFGEYEPLRRIAPGKATLAGFADLWNAGRNLIWSSASGWQVYAHVVENSSDRGPLSTVTLWRTKTVESADSMPPMRGQSVAELGRLLGAAVGRARWHPEASGPTPWPYSALAPQGWWLGFDATLHTAVYLSLPMAQALVPFFRKTDGWEVEELPTGGVLAEATPASIPPMDLMASLFPHTVPAKVRPASLTRAV